MVVFKINIDKNEQNIVKLIQLQWAALSKRVINFQENKRLQYVGQCWY